MRLLITVPLLTLLVVFALSNTQPVRLGLWPLDLALEAPLSVAVLVGMAVAFLIGGMVVWVNELGQRRRARDAEHRIQLLEAQIAALRVGRATDAPD